MKNDKCNACSGFPTAGAPCEPNKFTQAVVEINNPKECPILFHKVVIPVTMGDETSVPPEIGKYSNVLLVYKINNHAYLYSSDGVPTVLNNGIMNYEEATNLPQINGVTLLGNKTSEDLHITGSSLKITIDWATQTWSGADSVEDIYDYFANKGKVVFSDSADDGGEYSYDIIFMGYIPDEHKILGVVQFGNVVNDGEGHQEFDGTFAYGTIELYNQDRGVFAGSMEVQRALSVVPNTGLNFDYGDTLSGVPATEDSLGMIKVGPGLDITENGVLTVTEDIKGFDTVADMKSADNLAAGSFAETYGFYTKGDGGGAKYKVRELIGTDTIDEMTEIAIGENLIASLIYSDGINVKKLGAKGDGANDDTDAITKAISIVNEVNIPSGTYLVRSGFTLKNNLSITGDNTILKQKDGSNITNIFTGNGTKNLTIKNITIDFNLDNQTYSNRANQGRGVLVTNNGNNLNFENFNTERMFGSFVYITDSTNINTTNCHIKDPDGAYSTYGIFVVRCQHVLCEKCSFEGVRNYGVALSSYGFHAKDSCLDVMVTKCSFNKMQCIIDGSKSDGTATISTSVKIINNLMIDTPGDTTIRYSRYGLIANNITRGSGDYGLSVGNSEFISVDNNVVEGSNTVGIGLRTSPQCSITNNTIINPCQNFRNLELVANQRDGIYVIGNSRRGIITGNNIMDNNATAKMYSAIAVEDVSGGTPGADDSFAVICNNSTYGSSSGTAIRAENLKNVIDNNYIPA